MASTCTFIYLLENPPPLPVKLPLAGPLGGFPAVPANPITAPRLRLEGIAGTQLPAPTGGPFRLKLYPKNVPNPPFPHLAPAPALGLRMVGFRVLFPEEEIPAPRPVPAEFDQQPSPDGSLGFDLELKPCDYEALYYDGAIQLHLPTSAAQALANFHYYTLVQTSMPAVFDENFPDLEFDGYIPDEGGGG